MIKKFQDTIAEEIEKLSVELSLPPAELYDPIRYTLAMGGKRIRPLLVMMGCDLFGGKTDDAIAPALAVELFHNFTLVHDDIMDNAPLRRNKVTVHSKWNTPTAILSGDVMMVKAYQLLCRSKLPPHVFDSVLSVFNDMAIKVCEGQQWDVNYEQLHRISIPQYFKMIELKTAVLLATCLKIGALIGGAGKEDAKNIYEFGKNTGIAFQLQDDLLDVYGDEEKFGKQKGGDILSNKKTFLLLKAMDIASSNQYLKEELEQWMTLPPTPELRSQPSLSARLSGERGAKDAAEKIEAVTRIYDFANIKKITEEEINSYHTKAVESFEKVYVSAEKKKVLLDFTSMLLKREV
ncbi:MAG: polyprenyl synthetase family protein [Bacteroidetes bacterium]|nr:polyprenyl synthetase family protein [Bacteroidota bacterium]